MIPESNLHGPTYRCVQLRLLNPAETIISVQRPRQDVAVGTIWFSVNADARFVWNGRFWVRLADADFSVRQSRPRQGIRRLTEAEKTAAWMVGLFVAVVIVGIVRLCLR